MKLKRITAVLCAAVLLASVISGCGSKETDYKKIKIPTSENDDNWEQIENKTVVLENDAIYFELDAATTHFKVKNKKSGQIYSSVPEGTADNVSNEVSSRMKSEITVCYYAEQTNAFYMYSDSDSVSKNSFTVKTNGTAVRVCYDMGSINQVLPVVFDQKTFETVIERFDNGALRRRMERFYVLYSETDKPDDYADKLNKYPVLSKQPLYILSDILSDTDKSDIISDFISVGFTESEYFKMLETLDIDDADEDMPAGFKVPIEYSLTDDGFKAAVLSDRIEESSDKFKLYTVDFLEYFAAPDDNCNGAFVIPDGAGTLIQLNGKRNMEFSKPFYGDDMAIQPSMASNVGETLTLPVYGVTTNKGGIFAIVEEAAETASLKAYSSGDAVSLSHIYPSFILRSIDTTGSFEQAGVAQYNLFADKRTSYSPTVRYILLNKEQADYNTMAGIYRNYLFGENINGKYLQKEAPVYIDYLCMITEKASILGIPYTKKTVLSTVPEITASVKNLIENGIEGINVRLLGYAPAGLNNSVYNTFKIDRKVGTAEDIQQLDKLLRDNGGMLYLDADMQLAYNSGNGFSSENDAARYINRKTVNISRNDIVTGAAVTEGLSYAVSPIRYQTYATDFLSSLKKKWNDDILPGLSYGTAGKYLSGDYLPTRCIDPTESKNLLLNAIEGTDKANVNMLFNYGNAYILPYADGLLDVPLNNSEFLSEDEAIPFFSTVIHGIVPYAGVPYNLAKDSSTAYLRSVEYGAAPYALFITREDKLLSNTEWRTELYSLNDDIRLADFAEMIKNTYDLRQKTHDKKIIAHKKLSDTVFEVMYEGGRRVYVNYGYTDVRLGEVTVPSRGFSLVN